MIFTGPYISASLIFCLFKIYEVFQEVDDTISDLPKILQVEISTIVMKIYPIVPGDRPLMVIGYKYIYHKFLWFIDTEGAVSIVIGVPYLSCCFYNYSNVSICPIFCPRVIGRYFSACNETENHNRIWQSDISIYKYWVTHGGYFRLATTVVLGMGIAVGKIL